MSSVLRRQSRRLGWVEQTIGTGQCRAGSLFRYRSRNHRATRFVARLLLRVAGRHHHQQIAPLKSGLDPFTLQQPQTIEPPEPSDRFEDTPVVLLRSDRPYPRHSGKCIRFAARSLVPCCIDPSEPGCVNPVNARTQRASERPLYAASTGPTSRFHRELATDLCPGAARKPHAPGEFPAELVALGRGGAGC